MDSIPDWLAIAAILILWPTCAYLYFVKDKTMDCKHVNLDFESQIVMSSKGYHDCPYIVCSDCDEATPDGNCSDDTCDNY